MTVNRGIEIDNSMNCPISPLFLLCSVNLVSENDLCDSACLMTIIFTSAAYLEADAALTLSFGNSGGSTL